MFRQKLRLSFLLTGLALFLTVQILTVHPSYAQAIPVGLLVTKVGNGAGKVASTPIGIDCGNDCTEFYVEGTPVTLTATADPGSTFVGWQGACSGAGSVCTLNVTTATQVAAIFTLDQYQFTVTKAGNGTGKVSSSPAGIDCGNDCSEFYSHGALVTLTAVANNSAAFAGWVGACTGSSATCTLSIDAAKQATAIFILNIYTLSVTRSGNGAGKITGVPSGIDCGNACSASYPHGTTITLTATPDANTTFTGWQGACTGTATTCTLTMDGAKGVTGIFTLKQYTVNVTKAGDGGGNVSSTPSGVTDPIDCGSFCSAIYQHGAQVSLTATPATNAVFMGWQGACTHSNPVCSLLVDSAQALTATFALKQYDLTVIKLGNGGGKVTSQPPGIDCGPVCNNRYRHGTLVALTALATADSAFTGWQGDCSGSAPTCAVTVEATQKVTATFTLKQYALTVARRGNGEGVITSSPTGITCGLTCSQPLNHGTLVTLTATAAPSSTFVGWQGACTGITPTCPLTIDTTKQVTATFARKQYVLTVARDGNGGGAVTSNPAGIDCGLTCTQRLTHGDLVTLTATPVISATFAGWRGACSGTERICAITIDDAKAVTATFLLKHYDLLVTKGGNGVGRITSSPAGIDCGVVCTLNIRHGAIITLTAQPTSTSLFMGWSGACTGTLPTCPVTVGSAQQVTATFALKTYDLLVSKSGDGAGLVLGIPPGIDCGLTCTQRLSHGAVVTLTATAAVSSTFTGWNGACTSREPICVVTVENAKQITATFLLNRYDLIVTKAGNGVGLVASTPPGIDCGLTCNLRLGYGAIITLTARPAATSRFIGWQGACTNSLTTCQVTMAGAQQVTATFALNQYALTVTKRGNGAGNVTSEPASINCGITCTAVIDHGTLVTLTATTGAQSFFTGWAGACTGVAPCVVAMDGTKSITATFTGEPVVSLSATIATTPTVASTGQVITYHYQITNTGDLSLTLQADSATFGALTLTQLSEQTPLTPTSYLLPGHTAVADQVMVAPRCDTAAPLIETLTITSVASTGLTTTTQVSVTTALNKEGLPPQPVTANTIYIGCALRLAQATTAAAQQTTVDLVVIRGPVPTGLVLYGVREIQPYRDAFGLLALINALLREGCATGRVCHTVRQMTIDQGNIIQLETIEGLTVVNQLFLPLVVKRQ